jgi:hypothetical protein
MLLDQCEGNDDRTAVHLRSSDACADQHSLNLEANARLTAQMSKHVCSAGIQLDGSTLRSTCWPLARVGHEGFQLILVRARLDRLRQTKIELLHLVVRLTYGASSRWQQDGG